jgi:hypothetical protein
MEVNVDTIVSIMSIMSIMSTFIIFTIKVINFAILVFKVVAIEPIKDFIIIIKLPIPVNLQILSF